MRSVVVYRTPVTGIERSGGRVAAVTVGEHRIAADSVMVAAGGHNPEVAALAGVTPPGFGMRIEAMALEPVCPLIRPAIALIDSLCHMHQTGRGEVVGGTEVPERPRMSLSTDLPVLAQTAALYARLFPRLRTLRVLRHWAGLIHATPDYAPLIGEHPFGTDGPVDRQAVADRARTDIADRANPVRAWHGAWRVTGLDSRSGRLGRRRRSLRHPLWPWPVADQQSWP